MTKCKLMKGLLGATALTLLSTGTAFAQITPNAFTQAGTTVSNTFTLDYQVNNTAQLEINNVGAETVFAVDRLVNLTVSSLGNPFVVPNQVDQELAFVVANVGNDTHAYLLSATQVTGSDDDFNSIAPSTTPDLFYYVNADDTDGNGVLSAAERAAATPETYDAAVPPVIAPDQRIFVFIRQNIPADTTALALSDGDEADFIFAADTQSITSAAGATLTFTETVADTTAGNDADLTLVENVLADRSGEDANDGEFDGMDSVIATYIVQTPNVTATKTVFGVSSDSIAGGCDPITAAASYAVPTENASYFTPGTCVEYVIALTHDGVNPATAIALTDVLPDNLTFREAAIRGALVVPAGGLDEPSAGDVCDGTDTTCEVAVTGATLAPPTGNTPNVGYLVIRATID